MTMWTRGGDGEWFRPIETMDVPVGLWPDWADQFRRVRDDGRAEACLIARHGWKETAR